MRSTIYNDNSIFFNGFGLLYFLLFLYSFRYFSKVIPSPIVYYLSILCYFIRSCEIFFMANDWLSSLEFLYSSLIYVAFFHLIVFSWLYINQKFLKTVSVEATINKEGKNCLVNDLKYFAKILLKTPEFFLIGIMWNIGIIILFYLLKFKEVAPFVMVLGILFLAASYFISTMQYFKVSQTPVFQKEGGGKNLVQLIVFGLFGIGLLNVLPLINYPLMKENFIMFQSLFYACEILTIHCANQLVNFRWAQYLILPQLLIG